VGSSYHHVEHLVTYAGREAIAVAAAVAVVALVVAEPSVAVLVPAELVAVDFARTFAPYTVVPIPKSD
jgi:hypothetical protein